MVNLKALIGRLNSEVRASMDAAAGLCMSLTHYDVEIDHYLMKLLDVTSGDVVFILKHFGVDRSRLAAEITARLDRMKTGSGDRPSLSPKLVTMMQEAWMLGSIDYGATQIRTGHTILTLLIDPDLRQRVASGELGKISADALRQSFPAIVAESSEREGPAAGQASGAGRTSVAGGAPGGGRGTTHLDKYTT